ncbi:TIGR00725 family protein [bacterium]|nr:TIGR00725 family protein [bacterium]RQV97945.1 MAG: TIGR00725 family protein [bacterium]
MKQRKIQIGVIGGREETPEVLQAACEVGYLIAQKGAVLFCGGLGGVMAAACKGAKEAFGLTVGILPMEQSQLANPYVDIVIPTGLGVARNAVIINACDGVIAIGGKFGTLSEMAFALQREIPIVSLYSWEIDPAVLVAKTSEEAVTELFNQLNKLNLLP